MACGRLLERVAKWLPDAPKRLALAAANIAVSPLYFCGWLAGFVVKSIRVSVGAVVGGYRKGSEL